MVMPGVRPIQAERMFVLSFLSEGGHGPFRGLVAPLRAWRHDGLAPDVRQPDLGRTTFGMALATIRCRERSLSPLAGEG